MQISHHKTEWLRNVGNPAALTVSTKYLNIRVGFSSHTLTTVDIVVLAQAFFLILYYIDEDILRVKTEFPFRGEI